MRDYECEEESRLSAYQKRIKERRLEYASVETESEESSFDAEQNSFSLNTMCVSNKNLQRKIDGEINNIFEIDKDLREQEALRKKMNENASEAMRIADEASKQSAGFGKKKKAIEKLQELGKQQAIAIGITAKAVERIAKLQEGIINATKALLSLSVNNIATSRSLYQQLELRLKGASETELSDFARKEILNVMKQLKDQQDIMARQEKLNSVIHKQQEQLESQDIKIEVQKSRIEQMEHDIKNLKGCRGKKSESNMEELGNNSSGENSADIGINKNECEKKDEKKWKFKDLFKKKN